MRPGSVIVDMAAERAAMSKARCSGESVVKHGVTIVGAANLARSLAADASALFARNLYNFLSAFWDKDRAGRCFPTTTRSSRAIRLTQGGKVVTSG